MTLALSATLLLSAGCGDSFEAADASQDSPGAPITAAPWFEEAARDVGIEFVHVSGHDGSTFYLPETVCGGAAIVDINNDGWMDAYLVQSGHIGAPDAEQPANQLFRNRGDGTFENVTDGSGAEDRGYGMGVAAGDYDNDGFVDLFVTNLGRDTLLRNRGNETFADVTAQAGVGGAGWSASAAFIDTRNTGWLDLFVVQYLRWSRETELECVSVFGTPDYCAPQTYRAPTHDLFYRNRGDGIFDDATAAAGMDQASGNGLGVIGLDVQLDGWTDIFVANDGTPNHLWINQHGERFTEEAFERTCAIDQDGKAKAGMGVVAADLTGDGYEDLLVVNLGGETDSLYRNRQRYFSDETAHAGLRAPTRAFTRFGLGFADFDHDGRVDLFQAAGRVQIARRQFTNDPYAEPNLLLRGLENGRFEEVLPRGGTATPLLATSRAAAFGDLDNDGAVDILIVNRDGPAHLLRNIVPDRGQWISFRVLEQSGRDAYHARLQIAVEDDTGGSRTITREVRSTYSYLAANDPRVHVGLGDAQRISRVTVTWPGGQREDFGPFYSGTLAVLRHGQGESVGDPSVSKPTAAAAGNGLAAPVPGH